MVGNAILIEMFEAIDIYCERTGPEFWSEPVNALTNVFFLIAAWFSWRQAKSHQATTPGICLLIGLIHAIGIGSFLFHTFANQWSELTDIVPIFLFQLTFLWLYFRTVIKFGYNIIIPILIVFLFLIYLSRQYHATLNGSIMYAPALAVTALIAVYHWKTEKTEPYVMAAATGTLIAALTFRTVDMIICTCIPLGTHFLWHTCNAVTFYLVMRGIIANQPPTVDHFHRVP